MPKDLRTELRNQWTATAALIVYSNEDVAGDHDRYYLETRPVAADGTLGPAKPVSQRFVEALATHFAKKNKNRKKRSVPYGKMPSGLLYADTREGKERLVWWTPPQRRMLFFGSNTGIPDGMYHMPGTVYEVRGSLTDKGGQLKAWVFAGDAPKEITPLLMGPFFNYYPDGRVCLGNAHSDLPSSPTWTDLTGHWERLFWQSINSHTICNPMDGTNNLVCRIKESASAPFDTSTLRSAGTTLSDLLDMK